MDYASDRTYGCRIYEYWHRGSRQVLLENDLIRMNILLDKGADITEILYKALDIDFMWKAPAGLREFSRHIPTTASKLGNNLDYYEGGWHESLPGGGPYVDGAEEGLHGEAALLPWQMQVEKDTADEIGLLIWCELVRYPFRLEKKITLRSGEAKAFFSEKFINLSNEDLKYLWGQHPVFGRPFLDEHCRLDTPATFFENSKTFQAPTSQFEPGCKGNWPIDQGTDLAMLCSRDKNAELLYLTGLEAGWYALTNQKKKLGIAFHWDIDQFPAVWIWKVFNGLPGWPWYGSTYNLGIEFWSGAPDYQTCKENGTLMTIRGRETIETDYLFSIYTGIEKVVHVDRQGCIKG